MSTKKSKKQHEVPDIDANSGIANIAGLDKVNNSRVINTDGGAFIEGTVKINGGDFVGRDKLIHTTHLDEIAIVFHKLAQAIEKIQDHDLRGEAQEAAKKLETEARKGEQADEKKVERWFKFLASMSDDIFDVATTTFVNPIAGVGKVFQKIAQKAKEEKK